MSRSAPATVNYSFGPGPWTQAVRAIILTTIAVFVVNFFAPSLMVFLGFSPEIVWTRGWIWQPVTYLFVHGNLSHILFNMLIVWMFGVDLERRWGARGFTTYYFVTGVGAGVSVWLVALLPFAATAPLYSALTIGASGACFGLLMAWALLFPKRTILFALIFPMEARYFVLILGAIAFLFAMDPQGGPVAHVAHLGGLLFGYLYLAGPRHFRDQIRYRLMKWKMDRMRRRFNVHKGGRDDGPWSGRVH